MKQRIRVIGIVQKGSEILIMKRSQGRVDGVPTWELPTGKIRFGEQPEEAIDRTLEEYLGVSVAGNLKLSDVVTFMAHTAVSGASQLSNLYIIYTVQLQDEKIEARERYSAYKFINPQEAQNFRLDEASLVVLAMEGRGGRAQNYREVANSATVYVDGSSRGNPGPSGIGYKVVGEHGEVLAQGGEFIGFATSRVAEYYAMKEGCEQAIALGLKSVRFVSDNLMLVNQLKGIYKVKNRDIMQIYDDIQGMLGNFEACAFMHVAREQNMDADAQANLAIDREFEQI